jgi:putative copper export protein
VSAPTTARGATDASSARTVARWGWATAVAALSTLALVLVVGGGAPPPAPPGLEDTGRLPAWIGLLVGLLSLSTGVATAGFALLAGGFLDRPRAEARTVAAAAAVLWIAVTVNEIGLVAWELEGRAGVFSSSRVQALLVQLALAALAALLTGGLRSAAAANAAVVAALGGLVPTVVDGHARSADEPLVAAVAGGLHVAGAAVWVGGLAALAWLALNRAADWRAAVPRYSRLALVAVGVLVASGVVSGLGHLDRPGQLFTSKYGAVITLKVVLLGVLVAAGHLQRHRVVERTPIRRRHFVGLAGLELTLMTLAMALAVGLGHTPPPS